MYLCDMFNKPKLAIQDFDYLLPDAKIAYSPAQNRADSKLLVWDKAIIGESRYAQIANFIPSNATLIFNNSKVIAARILFEKINAENITRVIEIFCLEPTEKYTPVLLAMQAIQKVSWHCLVGGAKKWKEDVLIKELVINEEHILFYAKKINQLDGKFIIEFSWNHPTITFSEILSVIGNIPLPPYIQRKANVLQCPSNGRLNFTKAMRWSLAAKNQLTRKKAWASQTQTNTYPNTTNIDNTPDVGLQEVNNTLTCWNIPSPIVCNSSTASNVPGKPVILCFNTDAPFNNYRQPQTYSAGGTKWPMFSSK